MIVPLSFSAALSSAEVLADLLDLIPGVSFSPADVVAAEKRGLPLTGRWSHSLVALEGGLPVGVLLTFERPAEPASPATAGRVVYPRRSFYLDGLAVAPNLRGRGLGSALVAAWLDSTSAGFSASSEPLAWSLQTNAASWNVPVQRLYGRAGFVVVGSKVYSNRSDVVMWRDA